MIEDAASRHAINAEAGDQNTRAIEVLELPRTPADGKGDVSVEALLENWKGNDRLSAVNENPEGSLILAKLVAGMGGSGVECGGEGGVESPLHEYENLSFSTCFLWHGEISSCDCSPTSPRVLRERAVRRSVPWDEAMGCGAEEGIPIGFKSWSYPRRLSSQRHFLCRLDILSCARSERAKGPRVHGSMDAIQHVLAACERCCWLT